MKKKISKIISDFYFWTFLKMSNFATPTTFLYKVFSTWMKIFVGSRIFSNIFIKTKKTKK
jgi:hypothetical protein